MTMTVPQHAAGAPPGFNPDVPEDEEPAKVQVSFTGPALKTVSVLAQRHGISRGEAVKRAVRWWKFISDQEEQGYELQFKAPDGSMESYKIAAI